MASVLTVRYDGKLRCETKRTKTGRAVHTDVAADHGGLDDYYTPIELTAAALGACVTSVMAIVAERSEIDLSGMTTEVNLEMAAGVRRIGALGLTIRVPNGRDLSEAVRKKLEATAHACPVKNSLHPDVQIALNFVYE